MYKPCNGSYSYLGAYRVVLFVAPMNCEARNKGMLSGCYFNDQQLLVLLVYSLVYGGLRNIDNQEL